MKEEVFSIGNYQINVAYFGASWVARTLNTPKEIIMTGATREDAINKVMDTVRRTQPKPGTLAHFNATEKLRYTNGYKDFGDGFSRIYGVK